MSNSLWPHGLHHTRLPCPSLSPRLCSNSCPLSQWCQPIISSSVVPFSSCHPSSPASRSLPVSQLFASGGPSIRTSASASVLPVNIQGWFYGCVGSYLWHALSSLQYTGFTLLAVCGLHKLLPGMWYLSSLTKDRTHVPSIGRQIHNHWSTREIPEHIF